MSLQPTFALTPRDSYFFSSLTLRAYVNIYGAWLKTRSFPTDRLSFDQQHANDDIHVEIPPLRPGAYAYGGRWYFRGVTGYVV